MASWDGLVKFLSALKDALNTKPEPQQEPQYGGVADLGEPNQELAIGSFYKAVKHDSLKEIMIRIIDRLFWAYALFLLTTWVNTVGPYLG